jgi:hypothetical protein
LGSSTNRRSFINKLHDFIGNNQQIKIAHDVNPLEFVPDLSVRGDG